MMGGHLGKGNIGDYIGESNRKKTLNLVHRVLSLPCEPETTWRTLCSRTQIDK